MKLSTIAYLGLSSLLLGLVQTPAMGFTLDAFSDFEGSGTSQTAYINLLPGFPDMPTNPNTGLDTDSVFGGQRTITVRNENSGSGTIKLNLTNQKAEFDVGSSTIGGADIVWDGFDALNDGQNIELDGGTTQRSFQLNIESLDVGQGSNPAITLNFDIKDTSGKIATISKTLTSDINTTTNLYFAYQDRTGDNVNLGSIDYIRFYTSDELSPAADFEFNFIQSSKVMPFEFSPTLGLLTSVGLFGAKKWNKRRKNGVQ
jgi:hypothetical protein